MECVLVIWFYASTLAPGFSTAKPVDVAMECKACDEHAELFHKVVGPVDASCMMIGPGTVARNYVNRETTRAR